MERTNRTTALNQLNHWIHLTKVRSRNENFVREEGCPHELSCGYSRTCAIFFAPRPRAFTKIAIFVLQNVPIVLWDWWVTFRQCVAHSSMLASCCGKPFSNLSMRLAVCPIFLQYSLPLPKGGRHAINPILSADQRVTYKPPRSRATPLNALDSDYLAGSSPFAPNDVTSRGVNIAFRKKSSGVHHPTSSGRHVNPNASRGRRRKK